MRNAECQRLGLAGVNVCLRNVGPERFTELPGLVNANQAGECVIP